VEYDYDKFGDTPQCIDQGLEKEGKLATVQGFGITETGTKGALLEANVTVISNTECKAILQSNITDDTDNQRKITKALPYGLDYGLLCAKGIMKGDAYTGACKGDSGGPLSQEDEEGRRTLIGIVSGGISCGKSYPGWYTRVAFFKSWIQCIIDQSLRLNNVEDKVKEACKSVVEPEPVCEDVVDQGLFDLRNIGLNSNEVCLSFRTGAIVDVDNDIFS